MRWISIEGNFGCGKTSLLRFIQNEKLGLHLAFPNDTDFNQITPPVSKRICHLISTREDMLSFEENLSNLDLFASSLVGDVFTDGSTLSLPDNIFLPTTTKPTPDLMVFLELPSLEINVQRRLNFRYTICQLNERQKTLDDLAAKFSDRVIHVKIAVDDLPEAIYTKVMKAIQCFKTGKKVVNFDLTSSTTEKAPILTTSVAPHEKRLPYPLTSLRGDGYNDIGPDEKYDNSWNRQFFPLGAGEGKYGKL